MIISFTFLSVSVSGFVFVYLLYATSFRLFGPLTVSCLALPPFTLGRRFSFVNLLGMHTLYPKSSNSCRHLFCLYPLPLLARFRF